MAAKHYAPTYRLAIFRPNGQPFASLDNLRCDPLTVEQIASRERGRVRQLFGWTPVFRVYYRSQAGAAEEVTHLFPIN